MRRVLAGLFVLGCLGSTMASAGTVYWTDWSSPTYGAIRFGIRHNHLSRRPD